MKKIKIIFKKKQDEALIKEQNGYIMEKKCDEIRYIDLCCGIGGFRVGINMYQEDNKNISFRCVYSADIKDDAIRTYNLNFNEHMGKNDIYEINDLPDFDLLCAGFPCQPFSSAGNKRGFNDKRGGIIFKIHEICKKYKPSVLILENVSNLLNLEHGSIIKKIMVLFEEIGYFMSYKKLNSSDYSTPQSRERVYIVGSLKKIINLELIRPQSKKLLNDIIDYDAKYTDIDQLVADKLLSIHNVNSIYGYTLQDKRGGTKNIHSWDIALNGILNQEESDLMSQIMTERRKKHWAINKGIAWMDGMPLTLTEIQTFNQSENLIKMLDKLVELKYLKLEKCKDLVDGKRIYKDDSEIGYNICKGKLSFPISTILDPNTICPTLTATDSSKLVILIDNKYIRKLTDTELKKICGFPPNFQIPNNVDKYDLFGNMVVPTVVYSLLNVIYSA